MRLSFVETMRGTLRDPAGAEVRVSFDVSATAEGAGRFALRGVVSAPPLADEAPAEGTLTMSLAPPAITYALRFRAASGEEVRLDAEKHPTPLAPLRSMTEMEAKLTGEDGRLLASGPMLFSLRDLPPFLRSWLSLSKRGEKRLDVRRRALVRQLLGG